MEEKSETVYRKYPRTPHLPWSPGATPDDERVLDVSSLEKMSSVVVTEKMDGENTTMYRSHIHARSLDSVNHPSRTWVKSFHAGICRDIPEGWRICGENLFAQHSIHYDNLPSYFLAFSIWNNENVCLSWDDTLEWCDLLGLCPVNTLYRGPFLESTIRNIYNPDKDSGTIEGYVVRSAASFAYSDFSKCVAKYVRAHHVTTDTHWMSKPVVPNGMITK